MCTHRIKTIVTHTTKWALLCLLLIPLTACGAYHTGKHHQSGSLSSYLYPKNMERIHKPQLPNLSLPLRVGVAFVPPNPHAGGRFGTFLDEKEKIDLLNRVRDAFSQHALVDSIEVIPTAYLQPEGGFDNLNQLSSIFQTDVIALVSYDQVQHTSEDFLSITYWTIVGAYIFEGEKNDTNTLIDLAVYHVPSQQLLFRAPGTSRIKSSATPVNLREDLRINAYRGFDEATNDLIGNLNGELDRFIERVKQNPSRYQVTRRPGFAMGGTADGLLLGLFALMAVIGFRRKKGTANHV